MEDETKIYVIEAEEGAYYANRRTGYIINHYVNKNRVHGLTRKENPLIIIMEDNGEIWNIGSGAKYKILTEDDEFNVLEDCFYVKRIINNIIKKYDGIGELDDCILEIEETLSKIHEVKEFYVYGDDGVFSISDMSIFYISVAWIDKYGLNSFGNKLICK